MASKTLGEPWTDANGRVELGTRRQETRPWTVDASRSTVEFEVQTFWGLSTVHGRFHRFEGFYAVEANGAAVLELAIDADSVDTGNGTRDRHLRSVRFFDVAAHPQMRFASTLIHGVDGTIAVAGQLEARGRRIGLAFEATNRSYRDEVEIEATTTLDQRELGMTFSPLGMILAPATLHVKARLTPDTR